MIKRLAIFLLAAYLGAGALLYFKQDDLIFAATQLSQQTMQEQADTWGFAPWMNAKGEQIGWQSKEGNTEDVLLVFHGNGGTAFDCRGMRDYCSREPSNWKTYLLEYPGYGSRPGKPSEESLTRSGIEAVDTLGADTDSRIWLLGHSLGSGVACATLRERPKSVAGLMLLTPFNSLVETAQSHYPFLIVTPLLRTRFYSEKNLKDYPGPVAVLVSGKDTTIPPALAQKLYDGYPGVKRLWIDPESDHDVTGLLNSDWGTVVGWMVEKGEMGRVKSEHRSPGRGSG